MLPYALDSGGAGLRVSFLVGSITYIRNASSQEVHLGSSVSLHLFVLIAIPCIMTSRIKIDWEKVHHPDLVFQRFPSRRSVVYGTKGIVSSSQPLATQAGLEILRRGGNAGLHSLQASFRVHLTVVAVMCSRRRGCNLGSAERD